jgi:hypothetical protein
MLELILVGGAGLAAGFMIAQKISKAQVLAKIASLEAAGKTLLADLKAKL